MSRPPDWLLRLWGPKVPGELRAFERVLGHTFRDRGLLRLALTHRSFANEKGLDDQNERLEFLGDAVLDLVAASMLFATQPELPEGELSRRKSGLVSEPSLARLAEDIGLGEALRLGVGEERSGGRRKPSLLSDALEAVFGAVYLDGGFVAARRVIEPLIQRGMESIDDWDRRDPKTRLQELVQSQGVSVPRYELIVEQGPDHDKTFTVECQVAGRTVGVGTGGSKKAAEQEAARAALDSPDLLVSVGS